MRRVFKRVSFGAALGSTLVAIAIAASGGCSLGLDESKIAVASADASAPPVADGSDAPDARAPGIDAFVEADAAPPFTKPDGGACTIDSQCIPANVCLTGRCDLTRQACVYDVCKQTGCAASACDTTSKVCSAKVTYGFHASSFDVGAGVGCGGNAARCIAAAYPYVYVGTTNGVIAYPMANPSNGTPAPIPVTGLPFLPSSIVASGSRVYFQGAVVGTGPSFKLAMAWIDAPADPLATSIQAQTAFLNYPAASVLAVFPSGAQSVLVVAADSAKFFPSVQLTAPLTDLSTLALFANAGMPAQATPAAASGDRMVTFRWDGQNSAFAAYFSLETSVGTTSAQNAGDQSTLGSMGPVYPANAFAPASDGSLVWSAPSVFVNDGGSPVVHSVRTSWLLAGAQATHFDATTLVDVETYDQPLGFGTACVGPVAQIDATTALVLAAANGNLGQTSVQVAKRGVATAALVAGLRYILPTSIDRLGAASSNGFGYVLSADTSTDATVHVFASACGM